MHNIDKDTAKLFTAKTLYSVGVISLGCDKNRIDTEKMLYRVRNYGHTVVNNLEQAQVVIVNTCAFIGDARRESVDAVFQASGGGRKVIVTGCMPQKFIDEIFCEFKEVDGFLGTRDYALINTAIQKVMQGERFNGVGAAGNKDSGGNIQLQQGIKNKSKERNSLAKHMERQGQRIAQYNAQSSHTELPIQNPQQQQAQEDGQSTGRVLTTAGHYAYLMISDGCDNNCSYCLIPKIRGRYRSFELDGIIAEARQLVSSGVKELILVAQDLTRYGSDFAQKQSLVTLLRAISGIEGIKADSIRLMYCYPERITDELIEEIASNDKIIKYIDMPLQHVANSVLKRMRRASDYMGIQRLIEKLRRRIPEVSLRSTFIVGFPGESDEDFELLINFLQSAKLDNAGFFAYSRERDTDAYGYTPRVNKRTAKQRLNKAQQVQRQVHLQHNSGAVGSTLRITVDGQYGTEGKFYGRTLGSAPEVDRIVVFTSDDGQKYRSGDSVLVQIEDYSDCELYAKAIKA